MCFGVELTMNNVAAKYFYTYHGLTPQLAGLCASMWGMMNLFARSVGGWISDWANKRYGMVDTTAAAVDDPAVVAIEGRGTDNSQVS